MKKKIFLMLPCIAAVAITTFVSKKTFESHAYETNSLLMQNVEALATGKDEQDDCHYKNGYTSFTGKKGGAYDCCQRWRESAPGADYCK